ncbi:hypothetical protein NEOLI_002447 [Neolecta irregularis DAH-3]|uniref:Uncharacterized protein n=1 Tax=Neolecta irregularis (strain DAH-3) TaxID=1198029 RepID=A0A1U7LV76_NEOID|nr:hypothetical protein NEOLI_002447 [Neolecta irregularis DAH-3]|eukprot:OLL26421.1 hypothetical protein NEOLI_002447 [Neolecta irregularis DAH-3]
MTFVTKRLQRSASYFTGTRYIILTVLAVTVLVYFRWAVPKALGYTNNPANYKLLDSKFGFYPSTVYDLFQALGPNGRRAYQIINYVDYIMVPMVLAHWFVATMPGTTDATDSWNDKVFWASNFLMCDVIENTCIWWLLRSYPTVFRVIAVIASLAGILKWVSVGFCVVTITWRIAMKPLTRKKRRH